MNLFEGMHEWSQSERKAKDEAIIERTFAGDESIFELAETSYEMAAINQILAWLDFPYQQRAYLDCLIAIAGGSERARFNATNIEIARQLRTGKNARNESLAKWVTRQKKKFQEWQARRQFNLVEITDGWFDAKRQKNTPASYLLHIVEWAKRAVANAKATYRSIWRRGAYYRRKQLRAIRRAAFDLLQSIPECPPLRLKVRTLSIENNFDRRAHSVVSFVEKNISDLYRMGMAHEEFVDYVIHQLQKLKEKPAGALANMLTPRERDPDKKAKVWQAILRGTLGELMNPPPEEVIDYTGMDVDGEAGSNSQNSAGYRTDTRTDITDSESDNYHIATENVCNSLNLKGVGRTFLTDSDLSKTDFNQQVLADADGIADGANHRTDISSRVESDHTHIDEKNDGKLLNPQGVGRTFCECPVEIRGENSSLTSEENMEIKQVQKVVRLWEAQVKNRIPAPDIEQRNKGAWDIAWQAVTGEAQRTEGALNFAIMKTSYSKISLEKLKPSFVDYVMARVLYWRDNVPVICEQERLERFRERLTKYIEIPNLNSL